MFSQSDKAVWSTKDPRSVRSREALRKAFAKLVESRPVDQISIRDIAAESGVGYTTFFRHYADKDDILMELITEQVTNVGQHARSGFAVGDVALGCLGVCRYVDRHRAVWINLLTGAAAGKFREVLVQLSRWVSSRRPPSNSTLPSELAVTISVSNVFDVLTWWLCQPEEVSPERAAELLTYVIAPLSRDS